jgi:CheY-like chemotaxis protein
MPRILAIESDPKRRYVLSTLVREHVKATLVVVPSVRAAIASIAEHTPDLIIAPTLLAPPDEAELSTHMKGLDSAPYIQMLTVPALDMLSNAPAAEGRRGLFGPVFNRRPNSPGLQYDRAMVAAQIVDGLERARTLRMEYAAKVAYQEMYGTASANTSLVLARAVSSPALDASTARVQEQLREQRRDERRIALRKGRGEVPWLSALRASWGAELQLINISSSGVLFETESKFAPGSTANLHLCGPETDWVVPARFIRSDVARIDGLGVRYLTAAAFTQEVDLGGPLRERGVLAAPPHELAALLSAVLINASGHQEPAHARFAAGVRELIGARDVQVRAGSTGSAGRESLYFDVPGDDRSRTTMQVTFDRNHDVTAAEFKLLKAAAWLTAAVLELEKPVSTPAARPGTMALLSDKVA